MTLGSAGIVGVSDTNSFLNTSSTAQTKAGPLTIGSAESNINISSERIQFPDLTTINSALNIGGGADVLQTQIFS